MKSVKPETDSNFQISMPTISQETKTDQLHSRCKQGGDIKRYFRRSRAILTKQQAVDIFMMKFTVETEAGFDTNHGIRATSVGIRYGVSEKTVRDIWKGRTWSHVTFLTPKKNVAKVPEENHGGVGRVHTLAVMGTSASEDERDAKISSDAIPFLANFIEETPFQPPSTSGLIFDDTQSIDAILHGWMPLLNLSQGTFTDPFHDDFWLWSEAATPKF